MCNVFMGNLIFESKTYVKSAEICFDFSTRSKKLVYLVLIQVRPGVFIFFTAFIVT